MAVRALFFDVFGTLVDWRTGILTAFDAVSARTGAPGPWEPIVDDWRRAYPPAMLAARQEPVWRNLDDLQAVTLDDVLRRHDRGLSAEDRADLVRAWRRLPAWPDTREGLIALRDRYLTATLSNGHVALMVDLLRYSDLRVDAALSAELAQSYKPDPTVYRTAMALLECSPDEAAMVAAHPDDLAAAAEVGMRTVLVRRPHEWGPDAGAAEPPDLAGLVVVDTLDELAAAPPLP
jgi:2-haloacid dehalogenase